VTDKTRPISASNPPDSRGDRGAKDQELLTVEGEEIKPKAKKAISQPTNVETATKPKVKSNKELLLETDTKTKDIKRGNI
jgi:hypothetical protein